MLSLEDLFCSVDDFCQQFEPEWQQQLLSNGLYHRQRERRLCLSEIMTILIAFHQSSYRNFKAFYIEKVWAHWHLEFPGLVSYQRFALVDAKCSATLVCLRALPIWGLHGNQLSRASPVSKSATIAVFANTRYLKVEPQFGLTSVDWFFGFKLHLVVNDKGELLNFTLTPGNIDDRQPVPKLLQRLIGKVFALLGLCLPEVSRTAIE